MGLFIGKVTHVVWPLSRIRRIPKQYPHHRVLTLAPPDPTAFGTIKTLPTSSTSVEHHHGSNSDIQSSNNKSNNDNNDISDNKETFMRIQHLQQQNILHHIQEIENQLQ